MQEFAAVHLDAGLLAGMGFPHAGDLPVIFKNGGTRYDADANEFLYERCLGYWPPGVTGQQPPMTPRSQRTYAQALADFLSYAAKRDIDLSTADYVRHIYGRYQTEMLAGTWSASGRALSPHTVNARVDRACEYLAWLAYKGRRSHFAVPTRDVSLNFSSYRSTRAVTRTVRARVGRARARRKEVQLPTDQQLGLWLTDVERRHGPALTLACELILQTAIRKAELIGWRIDTIPRDPAEWLIANPTASPEDQSIVVTVRYGTKGGNFGFDNGDKIGPERDILVPLVFARRVHEYRETARRRALIKLKTSHKGAELSQRMSDPHLFLDERSGKPIGYDRITNCWRNVHALPFKGWSPHGGRRWWACMKLWRALKMREAELNGDGARGGQGLIALATDIIRLEIKDQLGHLDLDTTHLYIHWVARQLGVALPTRYADYMQEAPKQPFPITGGDDPQPTTKESLGP